MRAVWVDRGNVPNWDLLRKHHITWVFIGLDEPQAFVAKQVAEIKARGLVAGVHAAWNWYPGLSGAAFADKVDALVRAAVPAATPLHPRAQINDETHDPARIVAVLRRWRQLRPTTATSWTCEGHQGGWFTPELVKTIVETKTRVVPQAYTGPMVPTDALAAVRDITKRGVPDSMVTPMYDGKTVTTPYAQGWFFTQGRMPS
jgi:hypothetical protein